MAPLPHFRQASEDILRGRRHRDKALLIGLEYQVHGNPERVPPLTGIHNDILAFRKYLVEHELYEPDNIIVLLDDGVGDIYGDGRSPGMDDDLYKLHMPNRQTILREFRRLVEDIREGDRRVLVVAGHGAQLINTDGTEDDKRDEVVLAAGNDGFPDISPEGSPLVETPPDISRLTKDHEYYKVLKGLVVDNEFRKELVDAMPRGSQLVAFVETCHSGTLLDLDSSKQEEVNAKELNAEDVHGCGTAMRDVSRVLCIGKARRFIRRQIRRMTVAVVAPVVLVHHALPSTVKRLPWKPARRDSGPGGAPPAHAGNNTNARKGTWDPKHSPDGYRMRSNPELACVVSFSSSEDSQLTMAGGPCQSMIQIMTDCLRSEPATQRTRSANTIHKTVCDEMYKQRCKVINGKRKGPGLDIRKIIPKLEKRQKPQVSTLKVKMLDRDAQGRTFTAPDTTLDEILEL
ncbi:hypothetical protein PsYK624_014780 [Phanerochaete sordida]|uniref:Uncharacterized protein n=1 Tax=Phanerochaete sordida TaxID=48140 RepID=A0A9P3G0C4_9APHY|nr:hypothetical protein PsYK624_014780 [Phanerochaete sordida]